jgi:hypothetical protein
MASSSDRCKPKPPARSSRFTSRVAVPARTREPAGRRIRPLRAANDDQGVHQDARRARRPREPYRLRRILIPENTPGEIPPSVKKNDVLQYRKIDPAPSPPLRQPLDALGPPSAKNEWLLEPTTSSGLAKICGSGSESSSAHTNCTAYNFRLEILWAVFPGIGDHCPQVLRWGAW